jgi:hypothetical protein
MPELGQVSRVAEVAKSNESVAISIAEPAPEP